MRKNKNWYYENWEDKKMKTPNYKKNRKIDKNSKIYNEIIRKSKYRKKKQKQIWNNEKITNRKCI